MSRTHIFVIIIFLLSACNINNRLSEIVIQADNSFEENRLEESLILYTKYLDLAISRDAEIDPVVWYKAGMAAWMVEQQEIAINYFENAYRDNFHSEDMLYRMAIYYRLIDNLSREITNLNRYLELYPQGGFSIDLRKRLFETYIESRNYENAFELWPQLKSESESDALLLENYFILNRLTGNTDELEETANMLLRLDSDNIMATEYLAVLYFWEAENGYQHELEAYDNNQTLSQYYILIDSLENLNVIFRLSRDYFEQLFENNPAPKYAEYLKNIYLRFGDQQKANYYDAISRGN